MDPAQSNEPIRRRYGYLALADDRSVFTYATTTTARRRNRIVYSDALQSMQTLVFCPSYCLNALRVLTGQLRYRTLWVHPHFPWRQTRPMEYTLQLHLFFLVL